jgi:hypothetical protein
MWNDVIDLRDFYASRLGVMARRMVRRAVRELWPDVTGQSVLGLGYATPLLPSFRDEAERVIGLMPARQGVVHWPDDRAAQAVTLAHEDELPLPDLSMDRVLLVHGLECSENLPQMMREIWRVMSDSGRLLVVVPNRRGIWARSDRTPFGHGQPYSPGQLSRLLRRHMFRPLQTRQALFLPPLRGRALLRSAPAVERLGTRWFPGIAGVIVMEACKEIYAGVPVREQRASRRLYVVSPGRGQRAGRERQDTAREID